MREVILLLLLLIAAQIQPQTITLNPEIETEINEQITITNNQPRPITYTLQLNEYSQYFAEHITPTTQTITLQPQESYNLNIRGEIPLLGPETHKIQYDLNEGSTRRAKTILEIPIEGTPDLSPHTEIDVTDTQEGVAPTIDVTLKNFGNIITYNQLSLEIAEAGIQHGEITYPKTIQVLPGEETTLALTYTNKLEAGDYTATLKTRVNEQEELSTTQPFRVTLKEEETTVSQGENLLFELKRYGTNPRITYTITQSGETLSQETLIAETDTLELPTENLQIGTYQIELTIVGTTRSETQTLELTITQNNASIPTQAAYVLLIAGILTFILHPRTRLQYKILRLEAKINKREKQLNTLIAKSHKLTR